MSLPRVTLAFLSWNRLHYLRATMESARRCIRYPDLEWIVSDNESVEPGLREYVGSLDWVQEKWFRTQTHAAAMNEIIERATGKYVLIWPEDVQFVVEGDWLSRLVNTLDEHPEIGSVLLNFLRRKTCRRLLGAPGLNDAVPLLSEIKHGRLRIPRRIKGAAPLATFGWRLPGVVGSGIPSITRVEHWKKMGPWKTASGEAKLIDSSLGAEDYMIARFEASGLSLQQAILMKPVAADIINDSYGAKAKVRRGKRYGVYTPPSEGDFYYRILRESDLPEDEGGYPLSFEKYVQPIGFELPLDEGGDMRKASINQDVVSEILPQ